MIHQPLHHTVRVKADSAESELLEHQFRTSEFATTRKGNIKEPLGGSPAGMASATSKGAQISQRPKILYDLKEKL
jgi:hypothetical protein